MHFHCTSKEYSGIFFSNQGNCLGCFAKSSMHKTLHESVFNYFHSIFLGPDFFIGTIYSLVPQKVIGSVCFFSPSDESKSYAKQKTKAHFFMGTLMHTPASVLCVFFSARHLRAFFENRPIPSLRFRRPGLVVASILSIFYPKL